MSYFTPQFSRLAAWGLHHLPTFSPLSPLQAMLHNLTPVSLPAWQGAALMVLRNPGP